jgi:hypothetical protein
MDDFIIARNPEGASSLPYLLRVPIGGGLWLKARDSWPRSVRIYCHPADPPDLAMLEIIERAAVQACTRRGPAIDLILDRVQNRRSQFVFTAHRGRSLILWQTSKAAASARPGVRIPYSPAPPSLVICIDTRERYPYRFAARGASQVRRALRIADYAVLGGEHIVGAVERKTVEDLAKCLTDGSLGFAMADLASLPSAAVVVEAPYSALLKHAHTPSGYLVDLVARLQVRHPSVPIMFLESRKLAEEWTFRFLRAAAAQHGAPEMALPRPLPDNVASLERRRARRSRNPSAPDE